MLFRTSLSVRSERSRKSSAVSRAKLHGLVVQVAGLVDGLLERGSQIVSSVFLLIGCILRKIIV